MLSLLASQARAYRHALVPVEAVAAAMRSSAREAQPDACGAYEPGAHAIGKPWCGACFVRDEIALLRTIESPGTAVRWANSPGLIML
jgi:hypothetical protein